MPPIRSDGSATCIRHSRCICPPRLLSICVFLVLDDVLHKLPRARGQRGDRGPGRVRIGQNPFDLFSVLAESRIGLDFSAPFHDTLTVLDTLRVTRASHPTSYHPAKSGSSIRAPRLSELQRDGTKLRATSESRWPALTVGVETLRRKADISLRRRPSRVIVR